MADVDLTITEVSQDGLEVGQDAGVAIPAGADFMYVPLPCILVVKETTSATRNLTLYQDLVVLGTAAENLVVSFAADEIRVFRLDTLVWGQTSGAKRGMAKLQGAASSAFEAFALRVYARSSVF